MSSDERASADAGLHSPPPVAPPPAAPPTVPYAAPARAAEARWPAVLGVIAIVVGVGGVLMGLWGIIWSQVTDEPQTRAMLERYGVPMMITAAFSTAVALLLLISGIGLLGRRLWGYRLIWVWAVAKIFMAMMSAFLGYLSSEYVAQTQPMPAGSFQMVKLFSLIGVFAGLLWGWTLPVFVFFWFGREKVRQEVLTWR